MSTALGNRAVVIGGGMGGLFAAAAVAEHFNEVVVIDRDEPAGPEPRKAVPQGQHFHVLLPGGMDAMSEWFPGFENDLIEAGSVPMIAGREFYVYTPEGRSYSMYTHQPEPIDGETMYVQSRPLLEDRVRNRVAGCGNVQLRYGSLVDAPVVADGVVTGVVLDSGEQIAADLVVDASGRNSRTARWLPGLGFGEVPESHVNCDIQYVSAVIEPDDFDFYDGVVFFVFPDAGSDHPKRFGAMSKLEGGRWLTMLGSRYGDECPTDWNQMLEFGRTLQSPEWSRCAEQATPVSDVHSYRLARAVRRHYDRLESFPDGLLPVGDSVCFFNPAYGQGMSAAAGQCRGLRSLLDQRAATGAGLAGLPGEFFAVANEWVRGPWVLAAMADFEHPECTGDFPEAEMGDLTRFGELMGRAAAEPAIEQLVADIITLRRPLAAVNDVQQGV